MTASETCENDPANNVALDGCDASCLLENGWTAVVVNNATGDYFTFTAVCGDPYRVATEGCDEGAGNNADLDGCKADCSGAYDGWTCTGGDASNVDTCTETCGDGHMTSGEACDDGNTANLDGCSSTCTIETGWTKTDVPNGDNPISQMDSICGDGLNVQGEDCDDGDTDGNGCLADCTDTTPGWHCDGGSISSPRICVFSCNDDFITGTEECEDTNVSDFDGCDHSCMIEDGWSCTVTHPGGTDFSTCVEICGDGLVVGAEDCDDGVDADGEGCNTGCQTGAIDGYTCVGGNSTDPTVCTETCGDNFITHSESCEDGNTVDGDGCDSACVLEFVGSRFTCTDTPANAGTGTPITVCTEDCGDGYRVGTEACDDSDNDGTSGCLADCSGEVDGWHCSGGDENTADTCVE